MSNKIPYTNFSKPDDWKNYLYSMPCFKNFERNYHPEYEKLWKQKELYPGNNKKIINLIIGNAAASINLDWDWIGDGSYMFGFYKKGGNKKNMIIKVPYTFSFKSLHSSMISYLKKEFKKSSNMSLSKKAPITVSEGFLKSNNILNNINNAESEENELKKIIYDSIKNTKTTLTTYNMDENGNYITEDILDYNKILKIISDVMKQFTSWIRGNIKIQKSIDFDDAIVTADRFYMIFYEKRGLTPYQIDSIIKGYTDSFDIGANIVYETVKNILKYNIRDAGKINKCKKYLISILKNEIKKGS